MCVNNSRTGDLLITTIKNRIFHIFGKYRKLLLIHGHYAVRMQSLKFELIVDPETHNIVCIQHMSHLLLNVKRIIKNHIQMLTRNRSSFHDTWICESVRSENVIGECWGGDRQRRSAGG